MHRLSIHLHRKRATTAQLQEKRGKGMTTLPDREERCPPPDRRKSAADVDLATLMPGSTALGADAPIVDVRINVRLPFTASQNASTANAVDHVHQKLNWRRVPGSVRIVLNIRYVEQRAAVAVALPCHTSAVCLTTQTHGMLLEVRRGPSRAQHTVFRGRSTTSALIVASARACQGRMAAIATFPVL